MSSRLQGAIAVLAAAAAGFVIGLPALDGTFVRDDFLYVATNPHVVDDDVPPWRLFVEPFAPHSEHALGLWRPLTTLSWRLDRMAGGSLEDPRPFHLSNLGWNAFAAGLFALILLSLGLKPFLSAGVAALFAAHPARCEAVFWISGRSELMMTAFALATVLALVAAPTRAKAPLAALCATLAFLCKEQGAALAILVLFAPGASLRERFRIGVWTVGALFVAFVARGAIIGAVGPSGAMMQVLPHAVTPLDRLPFAARFLAGYGRLIFLPHPLLNEYDDPSDEHPTAELVAGTAVAAASALALLLAGRAPRLAVAGALFTAPIAVVLNVVYRTGETFAERFLCLPLAGAALAAGLLLSRAGRPGAMLAATLALLATGGSLDRARDWRSQRSLAEAAVRDAPESGGSWHMLGSDRLDEFGLFETTREDLKVASEAFQKAVVFDPRRVTPLLNLAKKRLRAGVDSPATNEGRAALEDALRLADAAIAAEPRIGEARGLRGLALLRLERFEAAEESMRAELERNPDEFKTATNLANYLDGVGRTDESRAIREKALSHAEAYAAARGEDAGVWRAIAHLRLALGRTESAEEALKFGAERARTPDDAAQFYMDRAQILHGLGRRDEAERLLRDLTTEYARVLVTLPDGPARRNHVIAIGRILQSLGDRKGAASRYEEARRTASGAEARSLDAAIKALAVR